MARPSRHNPPDAPRRNWPVAGLAAVGFVVAGYLGVTKLGGDSPLFCTAGGGCDIVQSSRYAIFFGLPTALWGAALYAAIGGLALMGLGARRWMYIFLLAVAGVSFSGYLTYLQLFEIRAVCGYCVLSAVIAIAIFAVLLIQRPAGSGRRFPARKSRVVAFGAITAVATVLIGAGYFAGGSPHAATTQEALARHLADTGAMMYGAYW